MLLISLRILHIIGGTFVVGVAAFSVLVLVPRLERTPPRHAALILA